MNEWRAFWSVKRSDRLIPAKIFISILVSVRCFWHRWKTVRENVYCWTFSLVLWILAQYLSPSARNIPHEASTSCFFFLKSYISEENYQFTCICLSHLPSYKFYPSLFSTCLTVHLGVSYFLFFLSFNIKFILYIYVYIYKNPALI